MGKKKLNKKKLTEQSSTDTANNSSTNNSRGVEEDGDDEQQLQEETVQIVVASQDAAAVVVDDGAGGGGGIQKNVSFEIATGKQQVEGLHFDVSGSISEADTSRFLAELDSIASPAKNNNGTTAAGGDIMQTPTLFDDDEEVGDQKHTRRRSLDDDAIIDSINNNSTTTTAAGAKKKSSFSHDDNVADLENGGGGVRFAEESHGEGEDETDLVPELSFKKQGGGALDDSGFQPLLTEGETGGTTQTDLQIIQEREAVLREREQELAEIEKMQSLSSPISGDHLGMMNGQGRLETLEEGGEHNDHPVPGFDVDEGDEPLSAQGNETRQNPSGSYSGVGAVDDNPLSHTESHFDVFDNNQGQGAGGGGADVVTFATNNQSLFSEVGVDQSPGGISKIAPVVEDIAGGSSGFSSRRTSGNNQIGASAAIDGATAATNHSRRSSRVDQIAFNALSISIPQAESGAKLAAIAPNDATMGGGNGKGGGVKFADDDSSPPSGYQLKEILILMMPLWIQKILRFIDNSITRFIRFWMRYVQFESIWIFLLLLGIVNGISAWCIDRTVDQLHAGRVFAMNMGTTPFLKVFMWEIYSMALAMLAVLATRYFSLAATGSGIPEMKSILNGFSIPGYLTVRTLVSKIVGVTLGIGAGLLMGKDGPFVHISCIYAVQLLKLRWFRNIRESRALTKQVLAAACAVGMSSTIGVPIGGVLFSMEVTNTIFEAVHQAKGVFCAVCGLLAFRVLTRFGGNQYSSLFTTNFPPLPYTVYEIPLFVMVSLLCGMAGGFYIYLFEKTIQMRNFLYKRFPNVFNPVSYAACVAAICGISYYPFGTFIQYDIRTSINDLLIEGDMRDLSHDETWDKPSLLLNLAFYTIVKTVIGLLTLSLPIPRGLFVPVFSIGLGPGRFLGEVIHIFGGSTYVAGGYALVGACAFTAGSTGTIATAIIIFELTSQLSYMLPVLLGVTLGRAAGQLVSRDIYTTLGMAQKLPYLPDFSYQLSYDMTVREIMTPNEIIIPRFLSLKNVEDVLEGRKIVDNEKKSPVPRSRLKRFESARAPKQKDEEDQHTGLVQSATDMKQPSYLFPVTDTAGLYIGAISRMQLAQVFDIFSKRLGIEQDTQLDDTYEKKFFQKTIDVVRVINTDGFAANLPYNTSLADAMVLFECHRSNCFFITEHHRVIGRLDLSTVTKKCGNNEL